MQSKTFLCVELTAEKIFALVSPSTSSYNQDRPKALAAVGIVASTILSEVSIAAPELPLSQIKLHLTDKELSKVVEEDIAKRQALITADFTRSVYDESCVFQDEIDTYPIDKYVKGTKALFVAEESHVDLTGPVTVQDDGKVVFPFKEVLAFRLPFLHPKVRLSGRVELKRNGEGLIIYSREHWDQSVANVLKTAYL
eukprot:gene26344-31823_t